MIHRYGSDAALQALITKAESLISAVSAVASNAQASASQAISAAATAQNNANQAISAAATAQSTANQAILRTLTEIGGILPISKGGTGATSAPAALAALGAATRTYYTCNVDTSSWFAISGGGYYKTITVYGILPTDVPVVGVVLSSAVATAKLQGAAFACINRITTESNSITCYAYNSAPTTAITLQFLIVR